MYSIDALKVLQPFRLSLTRGKDRRFWSDAGAGGRPVSASAGGALAAVGALAALSSPAIAGDVRPLHVTVTSPADQTYSMSVETASPRWWIPSVGTSVEFETPAPPSPGTGPADAQSIPSGTVWGTLTVPESELPVSWNSAVLRLDVDPVGEASTLSVSASRTWTFGARLAASLTDTSTIRHDDDATTPSWGTTTALRLDYKPSGTALVTENLRSLDDGDWHTNLRAEQKIAPGLSLSASLNDVLSENQSKTILASFSRRW